MKPKRIIILLNDIQAQTFDFRGLGNFKTEILLQLIADSGDYFLKNKNRTNDSSRHDWGWFLPTLKLYANRKERRKEGEEEKKID